MTASLFSLLGYIVHIEGGQGFPKIKMEFYVNFHSYIFFNSIADLKKLFSFIFTVYLQPHI